MDTCPRCKGPMSEEIDYSLEMIPTEASKRFWDKDLDMDTDGEIFCVCKSCFADILFESGIYRNLKLQTTAEHKDMSKWTFSGAMLVVEG